MEKIYRIVLDVLFVSALVFFAGYLTSFYFHSSFIDTGSPEWLTQAFRIKMLSLYGFNSWIHTWSNGINIWQSYPFIPQVLTVLVAKTLHATITRSMVLITISIFIILRLEIYVLLRVEKFSPLTSFVATVLSFPITLYWVGVNDFALQFAFLFFPLFLYIWKLYVTGKTDIVFAFFVGISFYIHPILAFYVTCLWIIGIFISEKKVISLTVFLECSMYAIGSSFYWYPLLFKQAYTYTDPYLSSLEFNHTLLGNISWLGLSLSLVVALVFIGIRTFMPVKREWQWIKALGVVTLLLIVLVGLAITIPLPSVISSFQFTKGVTLIAIAICIAVAPFIEAIFTSNYMVFKFILLFGFIFAATEGIWITSIYSSAPVSVVEDPVLRAIQHGQMQLKNSRLWASDIDVTSYFSPPTIRLPYSQYPQLDSNQISPRLNQLILNAQYPQAAPIAAMDRLSDYFKVAGVRYIFFDELSPFTKVLEDNPQFYHFTDLGLIKLASSVTHVYEVPWKPEDAILIDKKYSHGFEHFPFTLTFEQNNDYITLDQYVHDLAKVLYSNANKPLVIAYPTQESLIVIVPPLRVSNLIYINESYSGTWQAEFNHRIQRITPAGPNYMEVQLDDYKSGGILRLQHSWPQNMIYLVLVIIAMPALFVMFFLVRLILPMIRRKYATHKNS